MAWTWEDIAEGSTLMSVKKNDFLYSNNNNDEHKMDIASVKDMYRFTIISKAQIGTFLNLYYRSILLV